MDESLVPRSRLLGARHTSLCMFFSVACAVLTVGCEGPGDAEQGGDEMDASPTTDGGTVSPPVDMGPPGPDVFCPFIDTSATARLIEGNGSQELPMSFFSMGGIRSLGGTDCEYRPSDSPGQMGMECEDVYDCGGCRIVLERQTRTFRPGFRFEPDDFGAAACQNLNGLYAVVPPWDEQPICDLSLISPAFVVLHQRAEGPNTYFTSGNLITGVVPAGQVARTACELIDPVDPQLSECRDRYSCGGCEVILFGADGQYTASGITNSAACESFSGRGDVQRPGDSSGSDCASCLAACRDNDVDGCCTGTGCVCQDACNASNCSPPRERCCGPLGSCICTSNCPY
jgi:hypothetical protein